MDKQIREHEKTIIELQKAVVKLKRARNTLLNISTLPPEVLGNIFQCNVTLKDGFEGLEEESHNFLFVCHHWLDVGLRTPGVWSFCGNTLVDWARWYRHSGNASLDLVLSHCHNDTGSFDTTLYGTLRNRAARDTIRRIHLWSEDAALLSSIISSLTAASEGDRSSGVESLMLTNEDDAVVVDVSDFFAYYRFQKLQCLKLDGCRIASWDLLTSRTAVLTTLFLRFYDSSPTPTTFQLLSMLASSPNLRELSLLCNRNTIPDDGGGESSLRVPLHYLKELELTGGLRHVLGLLHRLDHPGNMDDLNITILDCTVADIPHFFGPYLRDHFRRRGRSSGGLGLCVSRFGRCIVSRAGDTCEDESLPPSWGHLDWFVSVTIILNQTPGAYRRRESLTSSPALHGTMLFAWLQCVDSQPWTYPHNSQT